MADIGEEIVVGVEFSLKSDSSLATTETIILHVHHEIVIAPRITLRITGGFFGTHHPSHGSMHGLLHVHSFLSQYFILSIS